MLTLFMRVTSVSVLLALTPDCSMGQVTLPSSGCSIKYDHDLAGNRTSRYWYCWGTSSLSDSFDHSGKDTTHVEGSKSARLLEHIGLSLHPNPASEQVHFTLSSPLDQANYRVIDMNGRVVRDGTFIGDRGMVTITELAPGAYHLHVFREDELLSRSFIVE